MVTGPDLRIGDADREATAASLREHYAQGRLTMEEFSERLDAAFAAVTQGHLNRVTRDLPHVNSASARLPASSIPPVREWSGRDYRYQHRDHHHQHYRRHPRRSGLASLFALAATLLLMSLVVLPDLHFPFPGKLGLLIAIFAVIRGVLRRILGGGRFSGYGR
jgi:hypothetical protein